jgi:DNA-binding NtrC family response regulator
VDSTLGEGTTLAIYLPIAREMMDPGCPDEPLATVMVVEDHRPMNRLISSLLHKAGYKVLLADTGDKAVAKMKEQTVDVVLLDLILAKDSQARDFTFRQLHGLYPETPILVTGGKVEAEVLATVIQAGAAGFVEKPYIPTKLIQLIKRETLARKNKDS